jgi:uncharacterized protein YukE
MSMDEQYDEMRKFHAALTTFNEHLRASMSDLEEQHKQVSPHWQDAMRRTYDAHWQPLEQAMRQYLNRDGPVYLKFLERKISHIERYLFGTGRPRY